jgi:hypothetical protein
MTKSRDVEGQGDKRLRSDNGCVVWWGWGAWEPSLGLLLDDMELLLWETFLNIFALNMMANQSF